MSRTLWMRRGAAVAAAVLSVLSIAAAVGIAGDVLAVSRARSGAEAAPAVTRAVRAPAGLKPVLRPGAAAPEVAIGEFLNGALGPTGLVLLSTKAVSVRPLGNGLRLAEVQVEGRGSLASVGAITNWVAVNRAAVRLKSLNAATAPDEEGRIAFVLLMVIA